MPQAVALTEQEIRVLQLLRSTPAHGKVTVEVRPDGKWRILKEVAELV